MKRLMATVLTLLALVEPAGANVIQFGAQPLPQRRVAHARIIRAARHSVAGAERSEAPD